MVVLRTKLVSDKLIDINSSHKRQFKNNCAVADCTYLFKEFSKNYSKKSVLNMLVPQSML